MELICSVRLSKVGTYPLVLILRGPFTLSVQGLTLFPLKSLGCWHNAFQGESRKERVTELQSSISTPLLHHNTLENNNSWPGRDMTSQTNEKHFANDVICRPTNEKQRHMTAHRQKRNTLEKTSYDAPKTNEKYFAKRHHMPSNRQVVSQTNEKHSAKPRHITSHTQTRSTLQNDNIWRPTDKRETLQKTSYVVSQTNEKHFTKDIIWRPTDERETLCKRRHVMLLGQGKGQAKVTWVRGCHGFVIGLCSGEKLASSGNSQNIGA